MFYKTGKINRRRAILGLWLWSGFASLLPLAALATQSVTFGWEPNPDPSVAGYNIYFGTASHVYASKVSFGNVTTATIGGLVEGTTYYFAASTYDTLNQESALSEEISYTVPLSTAGAPPVITGPLTNLLAVTGQPVNLSVTATGTGPLSYSLGSGSPAGAWINPTNGVFHWTPGADFSDTTNVIPLTVTDGSYPPQSATQSLVIVVQSYSQVTLGSTVAATGSTGSVTLAVYAGTPVTNLQFTLSYPPGQLTNFTFAISSPLVGTASLTQIAPGQCRVAIGTTAGQPLLGSQTLGQIQFNTCAGVKTAIVYLQTDTPLALKTNGLPADNVGAGQGRVTVVGQDSMLEALLVGGVRSLVVYGPVGASYQVESCNALGASGAWSSTAMSATMTNLFQTFALAPDANAATFYRARRTQ